MNPPPVSDLNLTADATKRSKPEMWSFRRPTDDDVVKSKKNLVWDFLSTAANHLGTDQEIPTKKINIKDLFEGPGKNKIKSIVATVLKSTKKTIANLNSQGTPEKQFQSDLYDSAESLRTLLIAEQNILKACNQVLNTLKTITEQHCNFLSSIMTLTCEMNKGYAPFWKLGPIAPTLYKWKSEKNEKKKSPPPPQPRKGQDPTSKWSFRRRDAHLQAEKSERLWDFLCNYQTSDCKRLLSDTQLHRNRLEKTIQTYHDLNFVVVVVVDDDPQDLHQKKALIDSAFQSAKKIIMNPNQSLPKHQLKDDFLRLQPMLSKLGSAFQEIIEATDMTAAALEAIYQRHRIFLSNIMDLTSEMNLRYAAFWDLGSLAPGRTGCKHRETDKGVMRRNVPVDS